MPESKYAAMKSTKKSSGSVGCSSFYSRFSLSGNPVNLVQRNVLELSMSISDVSDTLARSRRKEREEVVVLVVLGHAVHCSASR